MSLEMPQNSQSERILNLPKIEQSLPVQEKLNELFDNNILVKSNEGKKYILQTLSRIAVIANVNGVKIPFYQSSTGTGGKNADHWYPFFGNKGAWLIKGNIQELNEGYHIPEIKEMMNYLDEMVPEYLYTSILDKEQQKYFGDSTWKRSLGKLDQIKNLHSDFIIHPDEAAEYLAEVVGYDLKDAPDDNEDEKIKFVNSTLDSIKRKLMAKKISAKF